MEKFKGTPGPWSFDKSSGRVKSQSIDCVVDTCSSDVSPYDLEVDDHNGFLIAAAPDLLEALQYARRFMNRQEHDIDYIDAAIARALGKNDGDK